MAGSRRSKIKGAPPVIQQRPSKSHKALRQRQPMPRVVYADGDEPQPPPGNILRMLHKPEVLRITGVSYVTLWKWMRAGTFPLSFEIGGKTAWREDEVDVWLRNRPRSTFKEAGGLKS
jgi:prophage regulatory protein